MAVPTYTTDLALFKDFETSVTFSEFSGFTAGRGQVIDIDYPIQGNSMMSTIMNTTGTAGVAVDYGSNITWTSGWSFFIWEVWLAPGTIDSKANGGLVCCIGADISNYREWWVGGNDFGSYPYGGWQNFAVNPQITANATIGTPGTAYRWVGPGVRVISAVAKGSPLGVDVIRFGRGEFRVVAGESGNFANFVGMAATNDTNTNRWGLFQAIAGGYRFKGLMILGYGGLVNFTDSNKNIVIDNTQYVQSTFNTIEIRNASSVINMTAISMSALGTVSKGRWVTTDNATVNLTACTFVDMDVFGYASNSTLTGTTFRRCELVTQNSATLSKCTFDAPVGTGLLSNNPGLISGCTFTSKGTGHAIEINTPGTYAFNSNSFSGYATSNGTTGNEVIYNNSGGAVTINVTGSGTGTISVRNETGASTTVNQSIYINITVKDEQGGNVQIARVAIYKASDMTELMNTTTNASGLATTTYNYTGDTPVIIRVRKASDGAIKYISINTAGTIINTGLTATATFVEDKLIAVTTSGTIASNFTINTTTKTIKRTSGTTVYTTNDLYTWLMNYFDESSTVIHSIPMTAQTPTEYTLENGWFIDNVSFKYLKGGAIQTSGHASYKIHILTVTGGTYSDPVSGDITKTVVAGATSIGPLLDYEIISAGVSSKWYVRDTRSTPLQVASSTAMTITSGTGRGNCSGGSLTGENTWSNIYTLGTLVSDTTLDVYQNDIEIAPWWSTGQIDILVKVREAGSVIDSSNLTVLARYYSTLYDHFVITAATGRNPVPLAAFNDGNNQTAAGTVGASPYTNITITFGATSKDLSNGNGAQPYDVIINCATLTIAQVYEYLKYVTRTGSGTTFFGATSLPINGEYYPAVGDIRFTYTPGSGTIVEGNAITDTTSGATGYVTSRIASSNTLVIRNTHGTFSNGDSINSSGATGTINSVPSAITPSKQAPFGTFAGGKFFGARGVWIENLASADASNYILKDSTDTPQEPPILTVISVGGVEIGDRVSVFRTTGDNEIINKSIYISHNTANTSGLGFFTVTTAIDTDTPSNGKLRVVNRDASGNIVNEQSYAYTSWTGSVFTLSGTLSQTYNSDDTAYVPYIDKEVTSGTSVSVNITYNQDRFVVTRVRKKGILPFTIKGQVIDSGLPVTAIRTDDSIVV